ncbi:MAG: TolC family protein [Thermodesulfobacteriota bacterium]
MVFFRCCRLVALLLAGPFIATGCSGYAALLTEWQQAEPPIPSLAGSPVPPTAEQIKQASRPPLMTLTAMPAHPPAPVPTDFAPQSPLLDELAATAGDTDAAATSLADGLSLAEFEAMVLLRNPELQAAEEEFQAVRERYRQTEALTNLLSRYAALTANLETGVGTLPARAGNADLYPFPGFLALRGDIVDQEVEEARQTLTIARRTVLAAARRSFWELFYVRQAHAIAQRNYDVVDSLKDTAAANYAAGSAPFADLVRVDIEHGLMKEAIPIRHEEVRARETALLALLDLPRTTAIGALDSRLPEITVPPVAELETTALAHRQELRALQARIATTELLVSLAESEIHPGYTLNFSAFPGKDAARVTVNGERPESFSTGFAAAAGIGTPRNAFYGLNEGYIRETRRTLIALRHRLTAEEANTKSLIQAAWYQLARAQREERLYRDKVIPLARTGLDTTTTAYEAGSITFAGLLDVYSRWFSATLAWHRAKADLGVAWAGLEESIGASLAGEK